MNDITNFQAAAKTLAKRGVTLALVAGEAEIEWEDDCAHTEELPVSCFAGKTPEQMVALVLELVYAE